MSDLPPPPSTPPPSPVPAGGGAAYSYAPPPGRPPETIGDVYYSTGLTILLMFVTCGIWRFFWAYRTSEDLVRHNGDGLGGALSVALNFIPVVLMFTIPNEIERMYQRDGRQSPVTTLWGLWFLLPIIGNIIWYVRVQRALNDFWLSKGSRPA